MQTSWLGPGAANLDSSDKQSPEHMFVKESPAGPCLPGLSRKTEYLKNVLAVPKFVNQRGSIVHARVRHSVHGAWHAMDLIGCRFVYVCKPEGAPKTVVFCWISFQT